MADESLQDASSAMVETRSSRRVSNIKLEDYNEVDPTKDQHLYRWVMVYENGNITTHSVFSDTFDRNCFFALVQETRLDRGIGKE